MKRSPTFRHIWRVQPYLGLFVVVLLALSLSFNACCWFQQQSTPLPYTQSYALLKRKLDGGYYRTASKILKFEYKEEYNVASSNNKLTYKIYDRQYTTVLGVDGNSTPIVSGSPLKTTMYGDNRFEIDLNSLGLVSGNFYVLEVANDKNEKQFLRFKLD